jgi:hypothetical protein
MVKLLEQMHKVKCVEPNCIRLKHLSRAELYSAETRNKIKGKSKKTVTKNPGEICFFPGEMFSYFKFHRTSPVKYCFAVKPACRQTGLCHYFTGQASHFTGQAEN